MDKGDTSKVDVVVVGAGFAGLAAARTLADAGVGVRVVEARDRVGGRVYTKPIAEAGGVPIDLGGQWAGPTQHRLLHYLDRYGLKTFTTFDRGDNLIVVHGKKKRYRGTIPRLPILSLLNVAYAQWRLDRMAKTVPLDAPWEAERAAEWDSVTLGAFLDRQVPDKIARKLLERQTVANSIDHAAMASSSR